MASMDIHIVLNEYKGMLVRIASSYEADHALAQDLLQEIMLALWQALPKYRGEGSIKAFVARVAQNKCLTHVSKQMRHPKSEELSPDIENSADSQEETLSQGQHRELLRRAVRELPLMQRQVVTLALEGFTHREVAYALGISINNATVRFARAKEQLTHAIQTKEKV